MSYESCKACETPLFITSEHEWLSNGEIVMKRARGNRLVFAESDNIDVVFNIMGEIIGTPIDHIIMSAARRAFLFYMRSLTPRSLSMPSGGGR